MLWITLTGDKNTVCIFNAKAEMGKQKIKCNARKL